VRSSMVTPVAEPVPGMIACHALAFMH
jgi:hypothetical protein